MAEKKKPPPRAKQSSRKAAAPPPEPQGLSHSEPEADSAAREEKRTVANGPPIVGIGASAGGLDAFKKLLAAMPGDAGLALVLIPHLDPGHKSLMVELLARHSSVPVAEATDGTAVRANQVYIIPPNKYMTISSGVLHLTGPVERVGPQTAIDLFLRSLADDQQERAICVILSGTGSHGTLGLKAVKAAGGMAMVQDPATAEYPQMPQSALASGLADFVLPVEQMPAALIKYAQHAYVNGGAPGDDAKTANYLDQVLALVRMRTKLDYRPYRKKMLVRRIERRLGLGHFNHIADYLVFLREHPDEVRRLSRDLLIGVTTFFRDAEAWRSLETDVIAPLVRSKHLDTPLRVWTAGCATGEEAYSLGIVILEALAAAQKSCSVQIFATDVDEEAIETARHGVYPDSIAADVPRDRLMRFFTRLDDSSFQVGKQLREIVTFSRQDLLNDAPFSKLDLLACRNVFIYLEPDVQNRIIESFHFALNEGGACSWGRRKPSAATPTCSSRLPRNTEFTGASGRAG